MKTSHSFGHFLKLIIIPFYAVTLILPLFASTDYHSYDRYVAATKYTQAAGLAFIALGLFAFYKRAYISARIPLGLMLAFFGWAGLSVFWSIDVLSTFTSVWVFAIYIGSFSLFWQEKPEIRAKIFLLTGIAIYAALAMLPVFLPVTDRSFGGVQPNYLAHAALTGLFCFCLAGRYQKTAIAITAGIIIYTQARTALIGFGLFLLCYYWVIPLFWKLRAKWLGFTLLILASSAIGLIYPYMVETSVNILSRATGVENKDRLGTDFTGRTISWRIGIDLISDRPVAGYGFKTRGTTGLHSINENFNAHSGIINSVLDLGLIGGWLFIGWYLFSLGYCFTMSGRYSRNTLVTCASLLTANIPILIAAPIYISFAEPIAFTLLLSLLCPIMLRQEREPVRTRGKKPIFVWGDRVLLSR